MSRENFLIKPEGELKKDKSDKTLDVDSIYFRELGNYPLLPRNEEIKLGKRIQSKKTSKEDKEKAIKQLTESNLRLVVHLAHNNYSWVPDKIGIGFNDFINELNMALNNAARVFDPKKGKFANIAVRYMRTKIKELIQLAEALKRRPPANQKSILSDVEIIDKKAKLPVNLAYEKERKNLLLKAINTLSPRQKMILLLRFGLNKNNQEYTLDQISKKTGLTREGVRQIEIGALQALKRGYPELENLINE